MSESASPLRGVVYGGVASCFAEALTLPMDVVKTRLQMDGAALARRYAGSLDCGAQLLREAGPRALFKGLAPALLRQSVYGSLRYGLYAPIRDALGAASPAPLHRKVAAGAVAGAAAAGIATPTDLVKVRLQTDGMAAAPRYRGIAQCVSATWREEGVLGFWTGAGPTVGRATALAAAELATYDEVKTRLRPRLSDGLLLHASCGLLSGCAATLASCPFDVVKSRLMGQPVDSAGRGVLYRGAADCLRTLLAREGASALYRGFWPNLARIVPRVVVIFVAMEQLQLVFG